MLANKMWTPTHVIVTVLRARNLLEKGKGGNDAYCMIGMGKEKFLTSVKPKTNVPAWNEQAEFALEQREDLKITVYHKSSIIDEFIGRIVVNVSELTFEHNKTFTNWYKLIGKEKSDSKKPDKDRGEIEVRIEFVVRSKAGSMMDLSMKSKESSLSLRNLKESFNIKNSLGDKLKILNKSRKSSKFAGENQLAEQSKRMGGSKLDFLEGEDVASLTSSYSSINGPTLHRNASNGGQMNSLNRFNPARASFISKASSRMDNDGNSSANGGADLTHNEDDFIDENDNGDDSESANVNSSFSQRRNSSRFGPSHRQLSKRSSASSAAAAAAQTANEQPQLKITNPFGSDFNENGTENAATSDSSEQHKDGRSNTIHIAPLPPFTSTSTPTMSKRGQQGSTSSSGSNNSSSGGGVKTVEKPPVPSPRDHRKRESNQQTAPRHEVANTTIDEENTLSSIRNSSLQKGHQATMESFESSSFTNTNSSSNPISNVKSNDSGNASIIAKSGSGEEKTKTSRSTLTKTSDRGDSSEASSPSASSTPDSPIKRTERPQSLVKVLESKRKAPAAPDATAAAAILPPPEQYSDDKVTSFLDETDTKTAAKLSGGAKDEQIDWESSDDEEIVKREIETFERNQVPDAANSLASSFAVSNAKPSTTFDNFSSSQHQQVFDFPPLISLAGSKAASPDYNSYKKTPPTRPFAAPSAFDDTDKSASSFFDPFDPVFEAKKPAVAVAASSSTAEANFKDLFADLFTDLYPAPSPPPPPPQAASHSSSSSSSSPLNRIEENVIAEEIEEKSSSIDPAPRLSSSSSNESSIKKPTSLLGHQQLPKRGFPSEKIFSIDIDPFSSSSSSSSLTSSPLSSAATTPVRERSTARQFAIDEQQQKQPQAPADFNDAAKNPFDVDAINSTNDYANTIAADKDDSFALFSNLKTIEEITTCDTKMSEADIEFSQETAPAAENAQAAAFDFGAPSGETIESSVAGATDSGVMSQEFDENFKSTLENYAIDQFATDLDMMVGGAAATAGHHLITAVPPVTYDDEQANESTQAELKTIGDEMSEDEYQLEPPVSKLQSRNASLAAAGGSAASQSISIQDPFAQIGGNLSQSPSGNNSAAAPKSGPPLSLDSDESGNEDFDMDNAFSAYKSAPLSSSSTAAAKTTNDFDEALREANEQRAQLAALGADDDFNDNIDLALRQGDDTALFKNRLNLVNDFDSEFDQQQQQQPRSSLEAAADDSSSPFTKNRNLRQSERRRLMPTEDLTSDLNSEADFNDSASTRPRLQEPTSLGRVASMRGLSQPPNLLTNGAGSGSVRSNRSSDTTLNHSNRLSSGGHSAFNEDDEIKTPDFDMDYRFADQGLDEGKKQSQLANGHHEPAGARKSGLPDLINQKDGPSSDKAKKYLEDLDGVKFNDVQVPDTLKKQLEYFDREELLQLIAYQKKYLDYKESRIKDLENYIDNLVVKIIETEPQILMNSSNVLNKSRNLI